ncbi:hypothetical protein V2J09_006572 [Rumex salicifolius]
MSQIPPPVWQATCLYTVTFFLPFWFNHSARYSSHATTYNPFHDKPDLSTTSLPTLDGPSSSTFRPATTLTPSSSKAPPLRVTTNSQNHISKPLIRHDSTIPLQPRPLYQMIYPSILKHLSSKWREAIANEFTPLFSTPLRASIFMKFSTLFPSLLPYISSSLYINELVFSMPVGRTKHYVHGDLAKDVFIQQLFGFTNAQFPNYICKLHKYLWPKTRTPSMVCQIEQYSYNPWFSPSQADSSLFIHR